jgi:predicted O-methyltransferase YrrM
MNPHSVVARLSEPLLDVEALVAPKPAAFLREIAARVPMIDLRILVNAVSRCRPVDTLEVGLASGSTAIAIIAAKPETHAALHTALDPHQTSNFKGLGVEHIAKIGLSDRFRLIETSSHIALPKFLSEGAKFDFVYIDGNHKVDFTLLEWFYSDQMLKVGGVIAFDDCQWPMVQTVLNFIEANRPYRIIKHNDRTWLAVKMSEDRSRWFEFSPFTVPSGHYYSSMIEKAREKAKLPKVAS